MSPPQPAHCFTDTAVDDADAADDVGTTARPLPTDVISAGNNVVAVF